MRRITYLLIYSNANHLAPATWTDIEPALSIQPTNRGDGFVSVKPALESSRYFLRDPFFLSAVLEAVPAIHGHGLIGLGAAVLVSREFMDAEIAHPRPDVTARIMASIRSNQSVLATRSQVGMANAGAGVEVITVYCAWRDEILTPRERKDVQTVLASNFVEALAGFRLHRVLVETTFQPAAEFHLLSFLCQTIAESPELGRLIHLMTRESVQDRCASLGNVVSNTTNRIYAFAIPLSNSFSPPSAEPPTRKSARGLD